MTVTATQSKSDFLPGLARVIMPYGILALIVFAAYSNIFDNVFLYDDKSLIQFNDYLRDWGHIGDILGGLTASGAHLTGGFYRPLQMLLYLLVLHLGGTVFWFHLLNLLLHTTNTCLVYRLGTRLGFKPKGVFLAALVWGLHPLHTEAVTYMSATADPLFTFFCLWALVILVPDITLNKIFKIIPLFLLGLLSKETMAMFPLLAMTCLFLTNPRRFNIRTYFCTWPLWVITFAYVFWACPPGIFSGPQRIVYFFTLPDFALDKMYSEHMSVRIYTFLATLPSYLELLVWPSGLHMERAFTIYTNPWDPLVLAGIGILILAATVCVRNCRSNRGMEMSWGLLWFAAAHAPESGILIPINALFCEHWMYLPSIGLFLGLAETLAKQLQKRPQASIACSAIVLAFAGLMFVKTYSQNEIWHDPVTFYNNILQHERSIHAHSNLGNYYSDNGDYADALDQYKQALDISDTNATMRYDMALTYMKLPDWRDHVPDIISNLQRSLELDPNFYRSNQLLGDVYDVLGEKDKAKDYHDRAAAFLNQEK